MGMSKQIGLCASSPHFTASLKAVFKARRQFATDWWDIADPSTLPLLNRSA